MGKDCRDCQHYEACQTVCPAMSRLMDRPLKERLSNDYHQLEPTRDYKAVINEISASKQQERQIIGRIRSIEDVNIRAIASLIYARIEIKDIASILNISTRRIYQKISQLNQLPSKSK